jgi:hypothetical protein
VNVAENTATIPSATDQRIRAVMSLDSMPRSTAVFTIRPVDTLAAVHARPVATPRIRPARRARTERRIRRQPLRLPLLLSLVAN